MKSLMMPFLKKWFGVFGAAHVGMGLMYLFMTFAVPLSHTCGLYHHSHRCDSACYYAHPGVAPGSCSIPLKKIDYHASAISSHSQCIACLYLAYCNATEVNASPAMVGDVIPSFFQSLPYSSNLKQAEKFFLNFSRAPPFSIS